MNDPNTPPPPSNNNIQDPDIPINEITTLTMATAEKMVEQATQNFTDLKNIAQHIPKPPEPHTS